MAQGNWTHVGVRAESAKTDAERDSMFEIVGSCSETEKFGSHLPEQGIQDDSRHREDYQKIDHPALVMTSF